MEHSWSLWIHLVSTSRSDAVPSLTHVCLVPCLNSSTNTTLLHVFNISTANYTYYSYTYQTCATSATITFAFRHEVDTWCLDDVAVWNGSHNALVNGNFETGNYTNWSYRNPSNSSFGGEVIQGYGSVRPHAGNYFYGDGVNSGIDFLSQTFATIPYFRYNIYFYLRSSACANQSNQVIYADVSITSWIKDCRGSYFIFYSLLNYFERLTDDLFRMTSISIPRQNSSPWIHSDKHNAVTACSYNVESFDSHLLLISLTLSNYWTSTARYMTWRRQYWNQRGWRNIDGCWRKASWVNIPSWIRSSVLFFASFISVLQAVENKKGPSVFQSLMLIEVLSIGNHRSPRILILYPRLAYSM